METERLGVFVPDLSRVTEEGESVYGASFIHYHRVKCLVAGALAIAQSNSSECDECGSIADLLAAFLESMENSEIAFDEALPAAKKNGKAKGKAA